MSTWSDIVFDSSAVLAVLLEEQGGDAVVDRLVSGFMSCINVAEVADKLFTLGGSRPDIEVRLARLGPTFVPVDVQLSLEAAQMFVPTRRAGLSLGDRFCLALAKRMDLPALTGDRRWLDIADDIGVRVELFR